MANRRGIISDRIASKALGSSNSTSFLIDSCKLGALVTDENEGMELGVDAVVAFSVGEGAKSSTRERSTRFWCGGLGVKLVVAA